MGTIKTKEVRFMILLIIVPAYLLINYYVIRRILHWLRSCHSWFHSRWFTAAYVGLYALLASTLLFAYLLPASPFQTAVKRLSNYWLGTFLYVLLTILIIDLLRLILKRIRRIPESFFSSGKTLALVGGIATLAVVGGSVYGGIHAHQIYTTPYQVTVEKSCSGREQLNIVLISDLHLGYSIGTADMERMVEKINQMDADLICIAGDIFDNEYEALDDPQRIQQLLGSMKSVYGTYACWGNHDISERLLGGFSTHSARDNYRDSRMEELLTGAGITLLEDETVLIDDAFYLAGRLDRQKPLTEDGGRLSPQELLENLDHTKPIIVMDHQPKELQELADAGADLDLCGHTHDGQMFPGNLTVHLFWENACGYLQKGQMHNIVTSGVGVWGPAMRVGTKSEICKITVQFTS